MNICKKKLFHPACVLVPVVVVLLHAAAPAYGQTDYSLRMHVLGPPLTGIVDDVITDAFRNPGRLGGVAGNQFYLGQFPTHGYIIPFPEVGTYLRYPIHNESFDRYSTSLVARVTPLAFSLFTTLGESTPVLIAFETDAGGSERVDTKTAITPEGFPFYEEVARDVTADPNRNDLTHFLFALSVAGSAPEYGSRSAGAGLKVRYDMYGYMDGNSNRTFTSGGYAPTDIEYRSYGNMLDRGYEEVEAELRAGVFRPGSRVRELVAGAGFTRQTGHYTARRIDIYDEDYDGNGLDNWGLLPTYRYESGDFESNRDYRDVKVFGSLIVEWTEKVRSKHSLSWAEGRGDGGARYLFDDEYYADVTTDVLNETIGYRYDGDRRQYSFSSTIGLVEEVIEAVTISAGVRIRYSGYEFDENGSGAVEAGLTLDDSTYGLETPYDQNQSCRSEVIVMDAPVSLEWKVTSYFTVRLGLLFDASRSEYKTAGRQRVDVVAETLPITELFRYEYRANSYSTDLNSTLGFEFNLRNRLIIDLYDTYAGDIGFSYISARYLF